MGLEKYNGKRFIIYPYDTDIYVEGNKAFFDRKELIDSIELQHIKKESQLLQLLSLLTGKDQNEFKVQ